MPPVQFYTTTTCDIAVPDHRPTCYQLYRRRSLPNHPLLQWHDPGSPMYSQLFRSVRAWYSSPLRVRSPSWICHQTRNCEAESKSSRFQAALQSLGNFLGLGNIGIDIGPAVCGAFTEATIGQMSLFLFHGLSMMLNDNISVCAGVCIMGIQR